ncbi:hypothetical protein KP509_13G015400 [Ceratopteris richardii]|uniref:Chromo domain-containing protein n=1 Tax=Ceratopteris richardii TaxID=49495 RepID=A0A8T2TDL9_CERRI|nr:hypothetical protein KP509_13G015400 [Ceratopteris richardii]
MGESLFEIVEGGKKVPPILHTKDKILRQIVMSKIWMKHIRRLNMPWKSPKHNKYRHRQELMFKEDDRVLLRFEKVKLRKMKANEHLFPKLSMHYYGPFRVLEKINHVAYRLKLPESSKIHKAFHISLLRPFVGDVPKDTRQEEQPEVEELDEILVPEQILAHKDQKVKGKVVIRYLVKFKNYSPMNAKWMEEVELEASPHLLQLYL